MKNFLLLSALILTSCSSKIVEGEQFRKAIDSGQCERAINLIPETKLTRLNNGVVAPVKKGTAYVLTGTAYGTEFLVKITAGIAVGVAVCMPLMIHAETASKCFALAGGGVMSGVDKNFVLGKTIKEGTSNWKCPKIDHISIGLREVSACYKKINRLDKAREQLLSIYNDKLYKKCLSGTEYEKVNKELNLMKAI